MLMAGDKTLQGHCISRPMFANSVYALRAINAATDLCTAVLPAVAIFRLSNLNLDTKARIGASLTIAIGSAACIVTFVSFKYVKDYEATEDFLCKFLVVSTSYLTHRLSASRNYRLVLVVSKLTMSKQRCCDTT